MRIIILLLLMAELRNAVRMEALNLPKGEEAIPNDAQAATETQEASEGSNKTYDARERLFQAAFKDATEKAQQLFWTAKTALRDALEYINTDSLDHASDELKKAGQALSELKDEPESLNQANHTFKPGAMGITYDDSGFVEEVSPDGQAWSNSYVFKGDQIVKVGDKQFSKDTVVEAEKSGADYRITFSQVSKVKEYTEVLLKEVKMAKAMLEGNVGQKKQAVHHAFQNAEAALGKGEVALTDEELEESKVKLDKAQNSLWDVEDRMTAVESGRLASKLKVMWAHHHMLHAQKALQKGDTSSAFVRLVQEARVELEGIAELPAIDEINEVQAKIQELGILPSIDEIGDLITGTDKSMDEATEKLAILIPKMKKMLEGMM